MNAVRIDRAEALHLGGAVAALALVFAVAMTKGEGLAAIAPSAWMLFVSAVAVLTGFVPHELAHKIAAQRYGAAAFFRGNWVMLLVSVGIAVATSLMSADGAGAVLAAPGAVLIAGRISPRAHGIVSLVGPGMNVLVAALAWPLAITANPDTDRAAQLFHTVALVNGVLAVFNLLPVGPLDGRKVWHWSRTAYILALVAALALLFALLVHLGTPRF